MFKAVAQLPRMARMIDAMIKHIGGTQKCFQFAQFISFEGKHCILFVLATTWMLLYLFPEEALEWYPFPLYTHHITFAHPKLY